MLERSRHTSVRGSYGTLLLAGEYFFVSSFILLHKFLLDVLLMLKSFMCYFLIFVHLAAWLLP